IAAYLARDDALPVDTLYFGGGTPDLTPALVEEVIAAFRPKLTPGVEIAIEVYPLDATEALLGRLRAAGMNRISLGIESLRPAMLKRLARRYTPEEALAAIDRAKAAGFEMVDANLIFGIPGQSCEEVSADLETVLAHGVDQISAYPLFTFDHTPAGQPARAQDYARAVERTRLATQKSISRICRAAGLARTSVWSFTRAGTGPYTTVTRPDYIGFGAGAGSLGESRMSFNTFPVAAYIEGWRRGPALVWEMTPGEARANWLYWAIYTLSVDAHDYRARFGRGLDDDFGLFLGLLRVLGMARRTARGYRLTERGAIWVHRVQSLFSLAGIDRVWTTCTREAWPDAVPIF
ncbi:MAG: radical SAM protein, partial [Paracoccaceae bacterium]